MGGHDLDMIVDMKVDITFLTKNTFKLLIYISFFIYSGHDFIKIYKNMDRQKEIKYKE